MLWTEMFPRSMAPKLHAADSAALGNRQQSHLISLRNLGNISRHPLDSTKALKSQRNLNVNVLTCRAASLTPVSSEPSTVDISTLSAPFTPLQFPDSYYDASGRLMLKCLTLPELEAWCGSIGEAPQRRAIQIWRWIYYDRNWIRTFDDVPAGEAPDGVPNGFSKAFREKIQDLATLDGGIEIVSIHRASDGTRKLVFKLTAGPAAGGQVETVLIPIVRESGSKERITLCVSSQVGCAMNCQFCFTGKMGLLGNLTPGQIVEQMVVARRLLFEEHVAQGLEPQRHVTPITNIVYMGMGEPLDNLEAVVNSIEIAAQPLGLHFSYNKICVSTVGLVPQLKKFASMSKAVLAVSLHAATDEVRDAIVPVNRRYPLSELIATLEELCPRDQKAPRHGHHVLIEYTCLKDVNDRLEDARALVEILKNVRCKINLIQFNPHDGTPFESSTAEAMAAFRNELIKNGHVATVRMSRGDDKMAACGQLGNPELSPKRPPMLYKKKEEH